MIIIWLLLLTSSRIDCSHVMASQPFVLPKEFLDAGNFLTTANYDETDHNNYISQILRTGGNTFDNDRERQEIDFGANVSRVLTYLQRTRGYDKRIRPNYGGRPVNVGVTVFVSAISGISEANMDVTIDFYFRQFWHDHRLNFDGIWNEELVISGDFMREIWRPDTFFVNEKSATFHQVTSLNTFLRIQPCGNITQSLRLTVAASCPMNFVYFPMDSQRCALQIESYGYTTHDVSYQWGGIDQGTTFKFSPQVHLLPQFRIRGHRLRDVAEGRLSTGHYSRIIVDIYLERRLGFYIIQVYVPSSLIVTASAVSLYVDRHSPPARVTLGITTVLTMTTLISSTNAALPRISYLKAIDVYLVFCFIMVFAALLEYAAVSYLGKRCKMRKAVSLRPKDNEDEDEAQDCRYCQLMNAKASNVEKQARIVHPTVFACFNVIYWIIYYNASFVVYDEGFVPAD